MQTIYRIGWYCQLKLMWFRVFLIQVGLLCGWCSVWCIVRVTIEGMGLGGAGIHIRWKRLLKNVAQIAFYTRQHTHTCVSRAIWVSTYLISACVHIYICVHHLKDINLYTSFAYTYGCGKLTRVVDCMRGTVEECVTSVPTWQATWCVGFTEIRACSLGPYEI